MRNLLDLITINLMKIKEVDIGKDKKHLVSYVSLLKVKEKRRKKII